MLQRRHLTGNGVEHLLLFEDGMSTYCKATRNNAGDTRDLGLRKPELEIGRNKDSRENTLVHHPLVVFWARQYMD